MRLIAGLIVVAAAAWGQSWNAQTGGTTAGLRGASAVDGRIVWASGTGGTFLRTTDGGAAWTAARVPGAEELDFRDVYAVDGRTAYLLSSGLGDKSRIYKTEDAGATWKLLFTNPDATGFFDAMAFWDARRGLVIGDPVDGRFSAFATGDGGAAWQRRVMPEANPGEAAFAASGSCLVVSGARDAWFATGGSGGGRVFRSTDRGLTWTDAATPIRNDSSSAGIFSLAFSGPRDGIAVGGDYTQPADAARNIAVTSDGGLTWKAPAGSPHGFRSAVAYLPALKLWIAVGTSGSDLSRDGGKTWTVFDSGAFNALAVAPTSEAWAVGPRGRIARFVPPE